LDAAAIATPHIAGYSLDGKAAATQMVVRAVGQFFSLPTDSFVVGNLPMPPDPRIHLANDETSEQELLYQAIHRTYNIRQDDARLRDAPRLFEKLRETYPLRREPLAYHIKGGPEDVALQNRLRALGFILDL
jgi:erythronate-4-phosphate dehydrogenase